MNIIASLVCPSSLLPASSGLPMRLGWIASNWRTRASKNLPAERRLWVSRETVVLRDPLYRTVSFHNLTAAAGLSCDQKARASDVGFQAQDGARLALGAATEPNRQATWQAGIFSA
jgi:hypothetical protein